MSDSEHFDMVVIGSGPAGEKGAAQAAYFGKRVCLIERAPKPGGAAVNTGTIPSKTLRETARTVRPGRATGRLVGGNTALVQQTIGTPYEIDTTDAILFLEEVRDPMSYVDERLVQLRASGLLAKVRGIVFGHLSLDRSEEDEFEDFVLDLVSDLGVPVLMDFPAGHENPNLTLPLGTDVELVAEEATGWIVYREDALLVAASPFVPAA